MFIDGRNCFDSLHLAVFTVQRKKGLDVNLENGNLESRTQIRDHSILIILTLPSPNKHPTTTTPAPLTPTFSPKIREASRLIRDIDTRFWDLRKPFWRLMTLKSCVATRFSTCVYCQLLEPTNVITLKTQLHAVNARWKRLSQRSFTDRKKYNVFIISGIEQV